MKKIASKFLLLVALMLTCGLVAQAETAEQIFKEFSAQKGVKVYSLRGEGLKAFAKVHSALKAFSENAESVTLLVINNKSRERKKIMARIDKLTDAGFTEFGQVKDDSKDIKALALSSVDGNITEAVVVVDTDNEGAYFWVKGKFTRDMIDAGINEAIKMKK